jgi:hypothetical protein
MATDEFRVHAARNVLQPQLALLRQEKGKEVHLEEQVAELVRKLCVIPADCRISDLVGLLDGVRNDRALGLLTIPGTLTAQPLGQLLEVDERLGEAQLTVSSW